MSIDPDLERELTDIANPRPDEIRAEQRQDANVRWNQVWFLVAGFIALFGFGFFLLLVS